MFWLSQRVHVCCTDVWCRVFRGHSLILVKRCLDLLLPLSLEDGVCEEEVEVEDFEGGFALREVMSLGFADGDDGGRL